MDSRVITRPSGQSSRARAVRRHQIQAALDPINVNSKPVEAKRYRRVPGLQHANPQARIRGIFLDFTQQHADFAQSLQHETFHRRIAHCLTSPAKAFPTVYMAAGARKPAAPYCFARVTICVGLTKRSAISSQTSVVTI